MRRTTEEINAEKAAKPRPDLIPGNALLAVGYVQAYGRGKHGNCTWKDGGTEQSRSETHIASAQRHLAEFEASPDAREAGSNLPVLWHAAAQLLIAIDCEIRHEGRNLDAEAVQFFATVQELLNGGESC